MAPGIVGKMSGRPWGPPIKNSDDGTVWQYYIATKFAWSPMYIQGQLVFMRKYWVTWPVDQNGKVITMYTSMYPDDPGDGRTNH